MNTRSPKTNKQLWLKAAVGVALFLAFSSQRAVAQTNTFPSSGNAGVGTTSPSAVLHVKGDGTGILVERNPADGGGAVINFKNSLGDVGFVGRMNNAGVSAANVLGLSANGSNYHLGILPNGNVGIGTTAPAIKLDVRSANTTTTSVIGTANSDASSFVTLYSGSSNDPAVIYPSGKTLRFGIGDYTGLVSFSEKMRIDNNGNVGIGTTSPGEKLQVEASSPAVAVVDTNTGGVRRFRFYEGATNTGDFQFVGSTHGSTAERNWMELANRTATGGISFWTNNAQQMSINSSGNVGIGTSTPSYKLDIQGGQLNASGGLCIAGDCKTAWSQVSGGGSSQWTTSGSNIYYNSGNVGIGTNSPLRTLDLGTSGQLTFGNNGWNTTGSPGLFWYSDNINYGIYKSAGSWSAPNYQQLTLNFDTGIVINGGSLYGKSGTVLQPNGGNVGIGTTSPANLLDVVIPTGSQPLKGIQLTGQGGGYLRLDNGTGAGNEFVPEIISKSSSSQTAAGGLYIYGSPQSDSASKPGIVLAAIDPDDGASATENSPVLQVRNYITDLMTIDKSGSVGIGTTTPGSKLEVAGEIRSTSGGFKFPDGTVQTTAASGGGGGGGTITGVTAGAGLTGGGTSGSVTVNNDDRGSTQYIFKNIANGAGTTQFSSGSNNDSVRFAGSGGTSVTFDAATKKVTIDGSTSTPTAANISAGQFGQNTGGGNYTFPGNVTVNGNINAKYQDVAEWVPSSEQIPSGTVVVLDSTKSNQVISSSQSYDTRVAGVISEQPGIALGESGAGKVLVATTGRVKVKVDASRGAIHIGDLLVTSDVPGMAMKSEPILVGGRLMHMPGTLIGKALEPLEKGKGEILVLLSLQ